MFRDQNDSFEGEKVIYAIKKKEMERNEERKNTKKDLSKAIVFHVVINKNPRRSINAATMEFNKIYMPYI